MPEIIEKHKISYISSKCIENDISFIIQNNTNFEFIKINSLNDLFVSLIDSSFKTDLILIDLHHLYNNIKTTNELMVLIDILHTIVSFIKYRSYNTNLENQDIKLALIIDINSDIKIIKSLCSIEMSGIYPRGLEFTLMEKEESIKKLIGNQANMPKKILDRLKPKKEIKQTIILTPRQDQILNLICDRGASNKVIAKLLNITESTVKIHITALLKIYNVSNRTQLVLCSNKINS